MRRPGGYNARMDGARSSDQGHETGARPAAGRAGAPGRPQAPPGALLFGLGIDVIEANASLLKGLSPPPPEPALVRLVRWLTRHPARLEVVEVRLEPTGHQCRVTARASGERAAEALRVALSELSPAPRQPATSLAG